MPTTDVATVAAEPVILYERCFSCDGERGRACPFCRGEGYFEAADRTRPADERARVARVWCLLTEAGHPLSESANAVVAGLWRSGRNYHAGSLGGRTEAALLCDWDVGSVLTAVHLHGAGVPVYALEDESEPDYPTTPVLRALGVRFFATADEFVRWLGES